MIVQSWDTAIKSGLHHDASACTTFRYERGVHYLIDVQCVRLDYPALCRLVLSHATRYAPDFVLIEDKASGQSLLQELRFSHPEVSWVAIQPHADKLTRLAAVSPLIEAARVALPHEASWLAAFEAELADFPKGKHDDQVDAFSQYLGWFQKRFGGAQPQLRRM